MERRPPSAHGQNRAGHNSAKMKDAKDAYTQNDVSQGQGSHLEPHETQTEESFLQHMNEKLKQSAKKSDKSP